MKSLALIAMIALLAASLVAVPELMNYQGKLTDPDGVAIHGTVDIRFSMWDSETGGTELWFETKTVDVNHGLFDVVLGEDDPIDIRFDGDVWLQMEIEGEVLDTRQKFTTVANAFRAAVAESLVGGVILEHNELTGLQGGTADQYYHLTEAQHSNLHAPASDNQDLFASVTDGVNTYNASSETDVLEFEGTGGADVTIDGGTGRITIDASASGDDWGTQVVEHDGITLSGDGTTSSPLSVTNLPSGDGDYIQNQEISAQTADFWIDGNAQADGELTVGDIVGQGSAHIEVASTVAITDPVIPVELASVTYDIDGASSSVHLSFSGTFDDRGGQDGAYIEVELVRDPGAGELVISSAQMSVYSPTLYQLRSFNITGVDSPPAGSHTYVVRAKAVKEPYTAGRCLNGVLKLAEIKD